MATRRKRPDLVRLSSTPWADAVRLVLERRYQVPWQKALELLKLEVQATRKQRRARV